jgi:hypothetical protein
LEEYQIQPSAELETHLLEMRDPLEAEAFVELE